MTLSLNKRARILLYVTRLRFPQYHPQLFLLYMLISYNQIKKWKRVYKVKSVPGEVILSYLEKRGAKPFWDDSNNTVVVNNKYLNDYQMRGGFIKLINGNKVMRIAFVIGADLNDQVVYVSNCLSYNLNQISALKLVPIRLESLKFASEVNISLISNSYEVPNALNDNLLKNYFNRPKIVHPNDFLTITLQKYAPEFYYSSTELMGLENIHFQCNKVLYKGESSSNAILCAVGETTLKQNANVQKFLAPIAERWRTLDDYEGCSISLCPYGLENHLNEVASAIRPFLQRKKLRLKPAFLLQGPKGSGKSEVLRSLSSKLGLNYYEVTSLKLTGSVYAQSETKIRNVIVKAKLCTPCILNITNFENFGKNAEGEHDQRIMSFFRTELDSMFANNSFPLILICSSNSKNIPSELSRVFLETFYLPAPDEKIRLKMLEWITQSRNIQTEHDILVKLAGKTHGFLFEDLGALVSYAATNNCHRTSRLIEADFDRALDLMQSKYNQSLGAPKVPQVQWSDVGGLTDVKHEIIRTINLPLKRPELLKSTGLKRSGILLYGPPGTGKTLMAKAVATECNLCFLSVKGPELLNMYVGQSEQNIREVFERAREASPCIIFFDELDSLAPNRGISGDSGGVMDRIVSQLLAEMDGLNQSATIFIIGATNRPDLIDPALLRPGRFDKLLYVGPCTDSDSKLGVLKALTRKFKLGDDVNLNEVIRKCPKNVTGADFYGMCSGAWMCAVRRVIRRIEDEGVKTLTQDDVIVNMSDFLETLKELKPSITVKDLAYFEGLQRQLGTVK